MNVHCAIAPAQPLPLTARHAPLETTGTGTIGPPGGAGILRLSVAGVEAHARARALHAHGISVCALQASFGHSVVEIEVMCASLDEVAAAVAGRKLAGSVPQAARCTTPLSCSHSHA